MNDLFPQKSIKFYFYASPTSSLLVQDFQPFDALRIIKFKSSKIPPSSNVIRLRDPVPRSKDGWSLVFLDRGTLLTMLTSYNFGCSEFYCIVPGGY